MKLVIDIGGTHIRYEIYTLDNIVESNTLTSNSIGLKELIEQLCKLHPISEVGISYAGQVKDGVILSAPNISIDEHNIVEYFLNKYNIKTIIENDLKSALIAEYHESLKASSIVTLFIGTGFGSAIMENGNILRGINNLAGELGHIPYKYSPVACGCGSHYCVEAFCSGSALENWCDYYRLTTEPTLVALEKDDSREAKIILSNFKESLLFAISTLVAIINPKVIVLGGGVINNNKYLLEYIQNNLYKYGLTSSLKDLTISLSKLKNASLDGVKYLIEEINS